MVSIVCGILQLRAHGRPAIIHSHWRRAGYQLRIRVRNACTQVIFYLIMAQRRSSYKEHYSFSSPSKCASRSARYRARKRARENEENDCSISITQEDPSAQASPVLSQYHVNEDQITEWPHSPLCDSADEDYHVLQDLPVVDPEKDYHPHLLELEVGQGVNEEYLLEEDYDGEDDHFTNSNQPELLQCNEPRSIHVRDTLYDGAPLTLSASNLLIMQFKMRHNLTDGCVSDLLKLLKLHCPSPNNCAPSLYHFKNHFRGKGSVTMKFHYFCNDCLQAINHDESGAALNVHVCTNPLCMKDLSKPGSYSSFIEVPIEPQLKKFFECK